MWDCVENRKRGTRDIVVMKFSLASDVDDVFNSEMCKQVFKTALDGFTRKLQSLEINASIQLLRRQPNFKGSQNTNQYRSIRHLCFLKEACDKHLADFDTAVAYLLEKPVEHLGFWPAYFESALEITESHQSQQPREQRRVEVVPDSDDDVLLSDEEEQESEYSDAQE